jgi:hypothetical protein
MRIKWRLIDRHTRKKMCTYKEYVLSTEEFKYYDDQLPKYKDEIAEGYAWEDFNRRFDIEYEVHKN